ncbi:E3 ubiquitin-protein ligase TRIM71-like isoform X1 [Gopherus evgoodei]|uniref:E3 ubiquitin-protein ligase TRIM71-like isoform X1 n=1 Tax=Gopherus evgoodei TaxID=1825980 RepID=UPI0011CF744F|nr:E3 ubiquitin-protein ligase TRIM71-like isoform X1 [Gopherus evgoodei]
MDSSPEADFQRCLLCQKLYGPTCRLQALPCLHPVCCQCLEAQRLPAAAFPAPELRCPICEQKATLSEPWGMDELPSSSFLLGNLQDVVGAAAEEQHHSGRGPTPPPRQQQQQHRWSSSGLSPAAASAAAPAPVPAPLLPRWPYSRHGEPPCSSWNEHNAASFGCLDFPELLGDSGVRAPRRVSLTMDHFIERLGRAPDPEPGAQPAPAPASASASAAASARDGIFAFFLDRASHCRHHGDEVLHFFCDTCSVPICWECTTGPHVGHNFLYLQGALQDSGTLTIQLLGDAQQGLQAIQLSIEQAQDVAEELEIKSQVLQSEIKAMTYRPKKALEKWEHELLWKVEKINQVKAKSLYLQVEKLRQNLNELGNTISAVQQVLEEGCSTDILLARDCMLAQVQDLKNVRGLQPQEDDTVTFTPPDQALYTAIKSMGFVGSGAFASLTRATGEGLKCALQGRVASFTVTCYDHDGNPCLSGGDTISAVVMGPDGNQFDTDVHDQQNGTYLVSYRPQLEGEHLVSVLRCNHHIENSPFKVMVKSGLCYIDVGLQGLSFISEENKGGASLPPLQHNGLPGRIKLAASHFLDHATLHAHEGCLGWTSC